MSTLPFTGPKSSQNGDDTVYRVAQLNRAVRTVLEAKWSTVWVAGELSDVTEAASGHVYFTLNDEREPAQVRVVMFRNDARRSKAKLADGSRVKLLGQVSLFTPRGTYQLIARIALPQGLGDLHANFERVRLKLEAEGLLAEERKRALPHLPRVLGIVTSRAGAALHDIIQIANTRCPVRIVVSPCQVQGSDAPASIVRALKLIQRVPQLDVVIVGRGGGASEDLVAFNDERVARAIAACQVPVVSAVGHEVDITIADLVADMRAATPSNAAELTVPERRILHGELRTAHRSLQRAIEVRFGRARLRLERSSQQLREPRAALARARARLTGLHAALIRAHNRRLQRERARLSKQVERLSRADPRRTLATHRTRWIELHTSLMRLGKPLCKARRAELGRRIAQLDALSPLSSLARGYAIALHEPTGKALLRAADAKSGDVIQLRLHEGELRTRVES
jgi:exodeoxyribonuclease VII large subunit